ncbi:MAG TPA: hypothetical protein VNN22_17920 [Verrucomicrobiae bacterium]|nr:hypothetical protein [Verrucomicrobiae bacterium]
MTTEIKAVEARRQELLGRLNAAESALRAGLHTHGLGQIARAHLERAMAHLAEAYIAINEINHARTVQRLVDDLVRVDQVVEDVRRRKFIHI